MLNKEVIKTFINDVNRKKDNIIYQTSMENAQWLKDTLIDSLEYTEQLESDNYEKNNIINDYINERRELIEKLEEIRKNNKAKTNCTFCNNTCNSYATCKVCQEILEIVKGENHE